MKCDIGDWPNEPTSKDLTVKSTSVGGSAASAYHTFTAPTGHYDARVKTYFVCTNPGTEFNSLIEIADSTGTIAKVGFNDNNKKLDVTNGTSTITQDVYDVGCDGANRHIYLLDVSSSTASTYTLKVLNADTAAEQFSATYSTAKQSAPTRIFIGWHAGPNDSGTSAYRHVLVRDGL